MNHRGAWLLAFAWVLTACGGGGGDSSAGGGSAAGQAPGGMSRRAGEAAVVEARRLARRVLERLAVADPIRRPYLAAELAALG